MMGRVQDKFPQTRLHWLHKVHVQGMLATCSQPTPRPRYYLITIYCAFLLRSASLSVLGMMNPTGEDSEGYTYQPPKDI